MAGEFPCSVAGIQHRGQAYNVGILSVELVQDGKDALGRSPQPAQAVEERDISPLTGRQGQVKFRPVVLYNTPVRE